MFLVEQSAQDDDRRTIKLTIQKPSLASALFRGGTRAALLIPNDIIRAWDANDVPISMRES